MEKVEIDWKQAFAPISYTPPERTGDDLLDDMMELMAYRQWVESTRLKDSYIEHMLSASGVQIQKPYFAINDYWYDY